MNKSLGYKEDTTYRRAKERKRTENDKTASGQLKNRANAKTTEEIKKEFVTPTLTPTQALLRREKAKVATS
jgi:hypothetical protein